METQLLLPMEVIINSLSSEDYWTVCHLRHIYEIRSQLRLEYGLIFNMPRTITETQFHSPKKHKSTSMDARMKCFKKLKSDIEYQGPDGVAASSDRSWLPGISIVPYVCTRECRKTGALRHDDSRSPWDCQESDRRNTPGT